MQIRFLKVFCDVVDRRSFSRAADDNGISQSSASQVVHQLEERLGVQLLDRSTRPFAITSEGERYYAGCRQIVREYDQLEQDVRALHDAEARTLVVAAIYSVGLHHMSAFLQRFNEVYPRAEVRLEYLHPNRVCESVAAGDADIGIVSYASSERFVVTPWRDERLVLASHPNHPLIDSARQTLSLSGAPSISPDELDGQSFVAFERGLDIRTAIDRALAKQGVSVNIKLEFDNVETIKRAIEIDAGVGILPEPSVRREVEIGTLAVAEVAGELLERPLGIIQRRDRPLNQLGQRFIELLINDAEFNSGNEAAVEASPAPVEA